MDYFKIVAVLKKKTIEYSYVPHKWEIENTLFWPQANLTKLRADPGSKPESDWKQYKCKVKKSNIIGLEEAELWEQQFVEEGTDTEGGAMCTAKHSQKLCLSASVGLNKAAISSVNAYNDAFDAIDVNQVKTPIGLEDQSEYLNISKETPIVLYETNTTLPVSYVATEVATNNDVFILDQVSKIGADTIIAKPQPQTDVNERQLDFDSGTSRSTPYLLSDLTDKNDSLHHKLDKILENQKTLTEMLKKQMIHQVASSDKLYAVLQQMNLNKKDIELSQSKIAQDEAFFQKFQFPLKTVEEVYAFNKELINNPDYRRFLLKSYTPVGGTDGNEEGKIIGKKLRAIIFSEHVLTCFSWTGMSRTSGLMKKEAFQICEGILSFFLDLLKLADNRWCSTKNEKFFKYNTLKHAKQLEIAVEKKKKKAEERCKEKPNEKKF